MSVDTTATGEFQPWNEALTAASDTMSRKALGGVTMLRRLDPEHVADNDTGARALIRLDFVKEAVDNVTSHMKAFANEMSLPDGSAASAWSIKVPMSRLILPAAARNLNIKSGDSRNSSRKASVLSVDAVLTARGLPNKEGATEQTAEHFRCDVSYNDPDWELVERTDFYGTPASIASELAATEASRAAYY